MSEPTLATETPEATVATDTTKKPRPAAKPRPASAGSDAADAITAKQAAALTEQVLSGNAYGMSEQAYLWDSEPVAYVAPGVRPQIVVLPAGRVSATELAFRQRMRETFATLNERIKADAREIYETEIAALGLSARGEERYRQANPFWEVSEPAPLGVIADSRDVRGSATIPALPEGLERRAPAA